MYKNNFVVAVKAQGKVLREFNDVITMPFGTDYTLYLKNKDLARKAVVTINIDGEDVLGGDQLMVPPNSSTDLNGFLKNSVVTNKFRFIEKTTEISNYRGDKVEDGLIEVKFTFEDTGITFHYPAEWFNEQGHPRYDRGALVNPNANFYSTPTSVSDPVPLCKSSYNSNGITVAGQSTYQQFSTATVGQLENAYSNIIIQLKGVPSSITQLNTTRTKVVCHTCGKHCKSYMHYCSNCGTRLDR